MIEGITAVQSAGREGVNQLILPRRQDHSASRVRKCVKVGRTCRDLNTFGQVLGFRFWFVSPSCTDDEVADLQAMLEIRGDGADHRGSSATIVFVLSFVELRVTDQSCGIVNRMVAF